jgi:protein-L-isoaspartate(D-aspartate) O-methyltransferase
MVQDTPKLQGLRERLLQLLMRKGIKSPEVLTAIRKVPRHFFLPEMFAEESYEDHAMPIGEGQTISQPYTVARQTELLQVSSGMKVLEIGTGSGYQCAVLCALGAKVFSVERNTNLHHTAKAVLNRLGYKPRLKCGDGTLGWDTYGPYDRIIVTAGSPDVPIELTNQLAPGGILVIPVGDRNSQNMMYITKDKEGNVSVKTLEAFSFVPLIGKQGWSTS